MKLSMKSAKAIIKSVTMFASWFASIDISENKDITFIELQQFLTRSIVGKNMGKCTDRHYRPREDRITSDSEPKNENFRK